MSFQKMYSLHDLNYQIIEYLKKEKVLMDKQMDRQTDRQTDRITSCTLEQKSALWSNEKYLA